MLKEARTGYDHILFLELCGAAGFSPRLTLSDVRTSTIRRYISHGMRLTVTSELKARNYFNGPEFKYVSIKNAPTVRLALATRNERLCPQQKEFISHAQKWYQKKKEQIL